MHKYVFRLFVTLILALATLQTPTYAQADDKTILIAISDSTPIVTDRMLLTAFKKIGYDVVVERMPARTAISTVNVGDKHVLGIQTSIIEAENPNLVRVPESFSKVIFQVYAKADSKISVQSWEDTANLKVAYNVNQNYVENKLMEYSKSPVKTNSAAATLEALGNGEADIAIIQEYKIANNIAPKGTIKAGITDEIPVYSFVNKEYSYLVPKISKAYQEMKADGTLEKIQKQQPIGEKKEKTILHISSYDSTMVWEEELTRGVRTVLNTANGITYINVPLNTRRLQGIELQKNIAKNNLCAQLLEKVPDVIIASDDNALDFVISNYPTLFVNLPVVFCGLNGYDDSIPYALNDNATGVVEKLSAAKTLEEMLKIYPTTKKVFVINDYSLSGQKIRSAVEEDLKNYTGNVAIEYNENLTFQQLGEHLNSLDADTLVLLGTYFTDKNNAYYLEADIAKLIQNNTKLPFFTLYTGTLGLGSLGGKVTNSYNHGTEAAKMALAILDGTPPSGIPIVYDSENLNDWIFDTNTIEKYHVNTSLIPTGATIINKKIPIYKSDPVLVTVMISIILLVIIVAGVLGLFLIAMRKRNAVLVELQKSLHTAEELHEKDLIIKSVKDRLEKTIESSPIGYAVTIEGKLKEMNNYVKEHFEANLDEYIRNIYDDPTARDEIQQALESHGTVHNRIVTLIRRTGKRERFQLSFADIMYEDKKAFITWAVSVEETELQKDSLRLAEQGLQMIVDTLPIPLLIVEKTNNDILYTNKSSQFMFQGNGTTESDGKLSNFVERYYEVMDEFDETVNFEIPYFTHAETEIDLMVYAREIAYKNDNCIIFICQNISDQKKQAEHLLRAAEKEREANQLKGVFLANMSHEIRTPMNAIIGLSQVALLKNQNDENIDLYKKINLSAKNLLSIINDILDFSKIEAEKLDLIDEEFCLEDVVSNSFMMASERIESKKIEMLLNISPNVPCFLYGDRTRLWQILKNLLDNSAKYTNEGRIVLDISVNEQKTDLEKVTLRFVVTDTGIGMSEEQVSMLFTPFTQFHNNVFKNKKMGTGLGMSITKQLVELQNGTIDLTSAKDKGTTVTVEIAYKWSDIGTTTQMMIEDMLSKHKALLSPVLLVDDDEYCLKIMSGMLAASGIESVCVTNSKDALQKVTEAKNQKPFHMIIVDYMLGHENGLELGRKIKEITQNVKLLMVTAYAKQFISSEHIHEAGFVDVIEKPFIVSSFIKKLCDSSGVSIKKEQDSYPSFKNARVLLCEDNIINQQVVLSMLEVFEIEAEVANNGKEAIELLNKQPFDLVFMDIIMPVMDGHEAVIAIRNSNESYKNVSIVALTANVMADEVARCLDEGMNGHIEKPIQFEVLQEYLVKFLGSITHE